jgi:hypothetical protein
MQPSHSEPLELLCALAGAEVWNRKRDSSQAVRTHARTFVK